MTKQEKELVAAVWEYYRVHGRHSLPWRQTTDPYHILVSEIMLQQTQVDRVVPKYTAFIERFPTVTALAAASLKDVLALWQGLGYNRRAQSLWKAAHHVVGVGNGVFPTTYEGLQMLPGVGPYTAGAIMAFAYNQPVPIIETNIRTVFLFHLFPGQTRISDSDILPYVISTLDSKEPRTWYAALMDYGSYLKQTYGNQNTRTKQYKVQSAFAGSDRQIRGAIVRTLAQTNCPLSVRSLAHKLSTHEPARIKAQLKSLLHEGLVQRTVQGYTLPI